MRLGGYILLELAVGASLLAGAGAGAYFGGRELFGSRTARASAIVHDDSALEAPPPPGTVADGTPVERPRRPAPIVSRPGYFLGFEDEALLAPLREAKVTRVKFNRGGSSVSMRVDFASGARAAFKPDQTNLQSIPRREVAAFRLNRLLGLSSVSPAIPRAIPKAELIAALDPESRGLLPRFNAEVIVRDGLVSGSVQWWIPEIKDATIGPYKIDSTDGIVTWKRHLTVDEPMPEEWRPMLAQISTMVAFDFLIDNTDRFSGSNTKGSPDGRLLYFMDNALSFFALPEGHEKVRIYLKRCQRFSRALYGALKALSREQVVEAMTRDTGPYARLLTEAEIDAVMKRRDYLVAYIDELIAAHGEEAVLVFE